MKSFLAPAVLLAVLSTALCAPVITETEIICPIVQMPPHHIDHVNYPAISGVSQLRRYNLGILYRFAMELQQGVYFLLTKLVCNKKICTHIYPT